MGRGKPRVLARQVFCRKPGARVLIHKSTYAILLFCSNPLSTQPPVPGPISGVVAPVIRSCLSKYVGVMEQGKMMSLVAAVETISGLLAPLIFNEVYPATVKVYPAAIYGVAAGITLVCLVAMAFVPPPDAHPDYALASVSEAGHDDDDDDDDEATLALLGSIQVAASPLEQGVLRTPVPGLRQ